VTFDTRIRRFTGEVHKLRLEMPGAKVDLSTLRLKDGSAPATVNREHRKVLLPPET
jgi:hypothetical protein